jgi:hypothetical protein
MGEMIKRYRKQENTEIEGKEITLMNMRTSTEGTKNDKPLQFILEKRNLPS